MYGHLSHIISLLNITGEIDGRIKFQKTMYILQRLGAPVPEKFVYYIHGPYSVDLQVETDMLVRQNIVQEKRQKNTYYYTLAKDAEKYASKQQIDILKPYRKIVEDLLKQDTQYLEILATVFYLAEQENENENLLRKKVGILKAKLIPLFDEAYGQYCKLIK